MNKEETRRNWIYSSLARLEERGIVSVELMTRGELESYCMKLMIENQILKESLVEEYRKISFYPKSSSSLKVTENPRKFILGVDILE